MKNNIQKNSYLICVVLFDDRYLDEILLGLTSISEGNITIIDAVSGEENLSRSIPIFAQFVGMTGKKLCKVLFSMVTIENAASNLIDALLEAGLDFAGLSIGEIYVVKLSEALVVDKIER